MFIVYVVVCNTARLLLRIKQQQQGEKKQLEKEPDLILILLPRRAAPSAEFSVDRSRHITSFLTMLGPSPDWNVGLTAEDLCTKECGWVQKVVQDLIPWDAGTDSGVTYEVSPRWDPSAWSVPRPAPPALRSPSSSLNTACSCLPACTLTLCLRPPFPLQLPVYSHPHSLPLSPLHIPPV